MTAQGIEKINYAGWENCYRLFNREIELIVTTAVGPRIIHFGYIHEENELKEFPETFGLTGGEEWRMYGGHRFWHAPEAQPRTYFPDNQPLAVEEIPGGVRLVQAIEPTTGMEKQIEIRLDVNANNVTLTHRLRNHNLWGIEVAPWALTIMANGGTAILPLPPRGSHPKDLLPTSSLTLWSYTNLADPRWHLGEKYILLRQDTTQPRAQKIGACVPDGWIGYANHGHLFIKRFAYFPESTYPDLGSNVEMFTNDVMIELETLGPMKKLEPGQGVEHTEEWRLERGVPSPKNDQDVIETILPRVSQTK